MMTDPFNKPDAPGSERLDEHGRPVTALVLMSGGLDSQLAAALMLEQGVRVIAVYFDSVFCHAPAGGAQRTEAEKACRALGIELRRVPFSDRLIPLVKNPPRGYGKNMNPCIDCRIASFRLARQLMDDWGAHFFVTGEVIGQRPMSQRHQAMRMIEREAGVEGIVLRPLSAKRFPPTLAEQKGWVDRERFGGIVGRSRKPQIAMAERLGITDYPASGGGCLLTDVGFALKVRELLEHEPDAEERDFELLKLGRHYRLPSGAKVIVGRNEGENNRLELIAAPGDIVLERAQEAAGPIVILSRSRGAEDVRLAAALCLSHSKLDLVAQEDVCYKTVSNGVLVGDFSLLTTGPLDQGVLSQLRI